MKGSFASFILFITVLHLPNHSLGQLNVFFSDTVIYTIFKENDTLHPRNSARVISSFGKKNELLQKDTYIWSEQERKWNHKTKASYRYFPDEIVETLFSIVGQFERKNSDKKYKLNKNGKIIECNSYLDLGKKLQLTDRWQYTYSKDTLQSIKYERNSTTFFKEHEINLTYIKDEIQVDERHYQEIQPGKYSERKQYLGYKNGQVMMLTLERSEASKPDTIISNKYNALNLLHSDTTFITYKTKAKNRNYLKTSQYYYTATGQLTKKIIYYLNPDGSLDKNRNNELILYKTHEVDTKSQKRPFEVYID